MRRLIFACGVVALITSLLAAAQQGTDRAQILGTWKVNTLKAVSGGQTRYPLGEHPSGFITITPERLWLLFVDLTQTARVADANRCGSDRDDEP